MTTKILRTMPEGAKRTVMSLPVFARFRERTYRRIGEQIVSLSGSDLVLSIDMRSAAQRIYSTTNHKEPHVVEFLTQNVSAGDHAIDIGAFIGFYTVLLGSLVGSEGRVWAFEPVPECARRVQSNVSLNGLDHVRTETSAVSNFDGQTPLALGIDQSSGHTGPTSSITRVTGGETLLVPVCTIDEYVSRHRLGRLDIVKIDVEGAEAAVLEGMQETLHTLHPMVLVEVNDQETRSAVSTKLPSSLYDIQVIGSSKHGTHLVARPLRTDI